MTRQNLSDHFSKDSCPNFHRRTRIHAETLTKNERKIITDQNTKTQLDDKRSALTTIPLTQWPTKLGFQSAFHPGSSQKSPKRILAARPDPVNVAEVRQKGRRHTICNRKIAFAVLRLHICNPAKEIIVEERNKDSHYRRWIWISLWNNCVSRSTIVQWWRELSCCFRRESSNYFATHSTSVV